MKNLNEIEIRMEKAILINNQLNKLIQFYLK